ncbi:uncharacterized protein EDB91DRAFT_1343870 [Suillus paluster]|uniref:uncharacterized protein n=1 Tax=Suillus paluster TaxID=48578 RepID=UPI001B86D49D|nr:uncharacterized protein EDB91DRAFT_1343870 [Suillus paluster]KAG1751408.1 hypothetical protein EDB91DRAFT_1343870 [Suillus paluster]
MPHPFHGRIWFRCHFGPGERKVASAGHVHMELVSSHYSILFLLLFQLPIDPSIALNILTSSLKSHLNLLHHSIAKHTRADITMAPVTITNATGGVIHVTITNYEDTGSMGVFAIDAGSASVWQRGQFQSMTVFRDNNPVPEVSVIQPSAQRIIE